MKNTLLFFWAVIFALSTAFALPNIYKTHPIHSIISNISNQKENIVNQKENTVNQKENIVNQKENIVNQKENIVNQKENIVNQKKNIVNQKENIVNQKENIVNQKENNWHLLTHQSISEKVGPNDYMPNAIHIKLKEKKQITFNRKNIHNSLLSNKLNSMNIQNIDLPYERFIKANEEDPYGISRIYEIKFDLPVDPYSLCEELANNPDVEYATPIFRQRAYDYEPNDPRYAAGEQYALNILKLQKAWDISKGNKNVKIAIVDSAIDWTHDDLKDNIWTNPGEIPNNGKDDDGNGLIDDVHGWDFVGNISSPNSPLQPDNDTKPLNSNNEHGTHVAGCASAVTNNNKGIASPGFSCSILPCKVGSDNIYVADILVGYQAILYAANMGADVINCSWGGPGYSQANHDVIKHAVSKGSVVVVAAGNSGGYLDLAKQYPAAFPEVLTVGSTGSNNVSTFSDYGVLVDVWAPGENIISTVLNNQYQRQSGTSMSSPLVAGVCGLVKSIHPNWSPQKVMMQVRSTVVNRLSLNDGSKRPLYFGMVNAADAVLFNNQDPNKVVPGIALQSTSILGGNAVNSYESNSVKINLVNYLAIATNVEVTISAYDNWVKLIDNTQKLGEMNTDAIKEMTFNIAIDQNCPWYLASIRLLVTIKADGNYINYDLLELPLNLPSQNEFGIAAGYIAHPSYFQISGMMMVDKNNGWFVGNDRQQNKGVYSNMVNGTPSQLKSTGGRPIYAVYAFDNASAIVGTGSDDAISQSEIMITTNGGGNWKTVNTSDITGFINFIHFYDSKNGVFLGDPIGNSTVWGCGFTTDGGNSWNLLSTVPAAQVGEDGLVGSGQFTGDKIWFGTTKGRVFYSSDRGKTWSISVASTTGRAVVELSFSDERKGIALISDNVSSANANRYLAQTSDGTNWITHPTINYTTMGLFPVYAFSPIDSKKQYILFSNGSIHQSDDNGNTWSYLQSRLYEGYILGSHNQYGSNVRLWQLGAGLSYLDFEFKPTVAIKKIAIMDDTPIDYGNLEITKNRTKILKLTGTGNSTTNVESYEIIPQEGTNANEFTFSTELPISVDVQSISNIRIRFNPTTTGKKAATINLKTDGEPLSFEVIGNAIPLVSVNDINNDLIGIYPNPASKFIVVQFKQKLNPNSKITLYNSSNLEVLNLDIDSNSNIIQIPVDQLPQGVYFLKIDNDKASEWHKLIIQK